MSKSNWLKIENLEISIYKQIELRELAARKLKIQPAEIQELKILRKSLDARKKSKLKFIYTCAIKLPATKNLLQRPGISQYRAPEPPLEPPVVELAAQPIIIGTGPAGLFAALALLEKGHCPLIFERGKKVEQRSLDVHNLWKNRVFTPNSNVQFGEGGAGTFSDGKLTTRKQDYFSQQVLKSLVRFGAPEEILYQQKPHIGTDRLRKIIPEVREYLAANGVQFYFNHKMEQIKIEKGAVAGITANGEFFPGKSVILAIGHSARDTFHILADSGVPLAAKSFAVGVRVEHPRKFIDKSQYGKECNFQITGAADYKLTCNWRVGGRGIYSFCVCPGGQVVLSASAAGEIVTNGMSFNSRDSQFTSAGILVTVHPADFPKQSPQELAGISFQHEIEKIAFKLAGSNYTAPAQTISDFFSNRLSATLPASSYLPAIVPVQISKIFPKMIVKALKFGLTRFDDQIPGFIKRGLMIAPETRTSSPVRILRNPATFESIGVKGLFPLGEGAGYAGGIVSSAADALKFGWRVKPFSR